MKRKPIKPTESLEEIAERGKRIALEGRDFVNSQKGEEATVETLDKMIVMGLQAIGVASEVMQRDLQYDPPLARLEQGLEVINRFAQTIAGELKLRDKLIQEGGGMSVKYLA